ncbi:hypothetical protein N9H30_00405 [bacterium]|jgi:hypothetical protein|nr:hypothetical protein [bacterium]|tara:strand:+ start:9459 stop:9776 length:318 start_codon:yes stop_codon:yes gene_type:complete
MALVSFETSQAGQGIGNGLGSKTDIVKIAKTNTTTAELKTILEDMQVDGFAVGGVGTADGTAFVSGTTDVVFVALQGAGADYTAEGTNAHGVTGAVTTVESIFKD